MARFLLLLETEVDFVDGDSANEKLVQNVEQYLMQAIKKATEGFSHRAIRGLLINKLEGAQIKGSVSL
jgi:hypothetical protein